MESFRSRPSLSRKSDPAGTSGLNSSRIPALRPNQAPYAMQTTVGYLEAIKKSAARAGGRRKIDIEGNSRRTPGKVGTQAIEMDRYLASAKLLSHPAMSQKKTCVRSSIRVGLVERSFGRAVTNSLRNQKMTSQDNQDQALGHAHEVSELLPPHLGPARRKNSS